MPASARRVVVYCLYRLPRAGGARAEYPVGPLSRVRPVRGLRGAVRKRCARF